MAEKKKITWNPDEVIKRPADKEMEAERAKIGLAGEAPSLPLTEEQKRARADRFVWKPGDLRRVR
jgi:hypothetical protein